MTYTKQINQLTNNDISIAGGKGASLGEMTQASFPVPDGFVILTSSFDTFIKENNLDSQIQNILNTVDLNDARSVQEASDKIQSLILSAQIPEKIKDEIETEFDSLNTSLVAVRSSATTEDSTENAWAGQLDSYLNTLKEKLTENVKKCWASLFTPRAIFYRFENNLDADKISVAVVVQKMVASQSAGVAFSIHPVTQNPNHILIEATFGLGEALVSGSITPDNYVVDKEKLPDESAIVDINVNREKQVLSKEQILELAQLVVKIEKHYAKPQDIEWAFADGKFYIVQSRPITTFL